MPVREPLLIWKRLSQLFGAPGGDARLLHDIVGVVRGEAEQGLVAPVLLHGLGALARGLLGLGELDAQGLVLGLQLLVAEDVAVDALQEVAGGRRGLADGLADGQDEVREEARAAREGLAGYKGDEQYDEQDYPQAYFRFSSGIPSQQFHTRLFQHKAQPADGQAHDVEEVARDALDEEGSPCPARRKRRPCPWARPSRHRRRFPRRPGRGSAPRCARRRSARPPPYMTVTPVKTSCARPERRRSMPAGLFLAAGLAEDVAVDADHGVGRYYDVPGAHIVPRPRAPSHGRWPRRPRPPGRPRARAPRRGRG